MYENVKVWGAGEWLRDFRTREGALFWTRVVSILVTAVMATGTVAGLLDPEAAAAYTAAWVGALEAIGRLIRGEVYAEATVDRLAGEAYQRGQGDAGLDRASPWSRPDGYGTTED